jgi:hypothetical protein
MDANIQPDTRKGVYNVFSTYERDALLFTALALVEIAQFVAEHPEIQEEAQTRRDELAQEEES